MARLELDSDGKIPFIYLKGTFPSSIAEADSADVTKKLLLDLTGISTATTITLTVPNFNGKIALFESDVLRMTGVAYSPATPLPALETSGAVGIFGESGINRVQPAMTRAEGRMQWLSNHPGWHRSMLVTPMSTVALSSFGCTLTNTAVANWTYSFPVLDLTQVSGAKQINVAYSGIAANAQATIRSTELLVGPGGSAGLGGYYFCARFSPFNSASGNDLFFCGLLGQTTAPGNTDPNAMVNQIGVGCNAADSNYQLYYNDGSGTSSQVDLGAHYVLGAGVTIQLELYCPPNSTTIYYRVTDLASPSTAPVVGNVASNVPAANQGLAFHIWSNTGTTGNTTPSFNLHRVSIESDI